jgi:serine/threonine protein kinase
LSFSPQQLLSTLSCIASALSHLHSLGAAPTPLITAPMPVSHTFAGISHGDLYGHNIMHRGDGAALLGDFGAATIYGSSGTVSDHAASSGGRGSDACVCVHTRLQHIEVRAFGIFMLELLARATHVDEVVESTKRIACCCASESFDERPLFAAIDEQLQMLIGRRSEEHGA